LNHVVGHLDLDYFYAQVEEVENPRLRGVPVVVCVYSGRTNDSGIVSAANYIARGYGVRSGIPISLAKKKLTGTQAVLIPMKHKKYEVVSRRVLDILKSHADMVEQTGIDEAFFDITHSSQSDYTKATQIAFEIKGDIRTRESLTSSIGLSQNKVLAKMASDFKKPDGLTVITPQEAESFLAPLPVEKLPGVGSKTASVLHDLGMKSIGDLSETGLVSLRNSFGRKLAIYLYDASRGIGDELVRKKGDSKQISRMITLKADTKNVDEISTQFLPAIEDTSNRLSAEKLSCRTISVMGIYTDLSTKVKSKTLDRPTESLDTLKRQSRELLDELITGSDMALRRVGIRVAELDSVADQGSLLEYFGNR
jgi:DNA polymerase IV (DinB-like DNA polymerase)